MRSTPHQKKAEKRETDVFEEREKGERCLVGAFFPFTPFPPADIASLPPSLLAPQLAQRKVTLQGWAAVKTLVSGPVFKWKYNIFVSDVQPDDWTLVYIVK